MHKSSYDKMATLVKKYVAPSDTILDVGSLDVNGTYRPLFPKQPYTGLDIRSGKNVDIVVSAYAWTNVLTHDILISGQCFEHVARPWELIKLMAAHCRKYVIIIAPFQWAYHAYPGDYYRYTNEGLEELAKYADLTPVESGMANQDSWLVAKK